LTFQNCNRALQTRNFQDGSTAAVAALHNREVIISHLGDSRVYIILDNGSIQFRTKDHHPTKRKEWEHVLNNHGRVMKERLDGILAICRAFGDDGVPEISHEPEIQTIKLQKNAKFLIVACDGVFDVIGDDLLGQLTKEKEDSRELASSIRNCALGYFSLDNISVIVKKLH
jgi:serine/threonine protein phosphatase PrpC